MSVGPVPNLGGAVSTASVGVCCAALQDSGNGYIALGPSGVKVHGCVCNVPSGGGDGGDCCTNGNGNGNGNGGCTGSGCSSCGGDGGGSGGKSYGVAFGAGPPASPAPGDPIICALDLKWDQCTCKFVWVPDTPANAPAGAFLPTPPSGAYQGNPLFLEPCAKIAPGPVPVGAITPPGVPTGPYAIGAYVENSVRIVGVPVTCSETGVTLPSTCATDLTFYIPSDTETYHLTTPAGTYIECVSGGPMNTYLASSNSGAAGELIQIALTQA